VREISRGEIGLLAGGANCIPERVVDVEVSADLGAVVGAIGERLAGLLALCDAVSVSRRGVSGGATALV